jgi:hypothetical protein
MRLLSRCPECQQFHVKEMGGTPKTFRALLIAVPRALDYVICEPCMSMMRTNHFEPFYEEFTSLVKL